MNEKQLLELKARIQKGKEERAELNGKIKHLTGELKTKFGCENVTEAKEKIQKLWKDIEKLENEIETKIIEIHEKYEMDIV